MSDLTNSLNRILAWLEEHSSKSALGFQPGLLSETIEEKPSILPFFVSREVYELYRWRNGDEGYSSVFGYLWFLNLDRACEFSQDINDENMLEIRAQNGGPSYLFPMFDFDGEYFAIQGGETLTAAAPIFHVSDCCDVSFAFINLTEMMSAIAECYETGIYAAREDGAIIVVDTIQFGEIRRKYNPGTVASLYVEGW
jgi:hypothetical protein